MASPLRIVIIGGGAGGLELAIRLSSQAVGSSAPQVTLIDSRPTHLWKPRLHEIATGVMVAAEERLGFAELGAAHGFDFMLGALASVDPFAKNVTVEEVAAGDVRLTSEDGLLLPRRTVEYDIAVLAIGSTSNDFGTPGVLEHCFTLDAPERADQVYDGLRALAARVAAKRASILRVVVVGAGLTGVELAAELRSAWRREPEFMSFMPPEQLEVTLVEMADRPLPGSPETMSIYARRMLEAYGVVLRFGAKVSSVAAGRVTLADGSDLAADMIVWVSRIKGPVVLPSIPGLAFDKGDRIKVDPTLRVVSAQGRPIDGLFAIGDCASCYPEGSDHPIPATAQAAHQQAAHLARSLLREPTGAAGAPFKYRYLGTLVSFGADVIGDLPIPYGRRMGLSGFAARSAYDALYRSHLAICIGWMRTTLLMLSNRMRRRARSRIKLRW